MELADLENFDPYKGNIISDIPKGNKGKNNMQGCVKNMQMNL